MPGALRLAPLFLFAFGLVFSSCARAQSVVGLESGSWDSDIWGLRITGPVEPGLRPTEGSKITIQPQAVITVHAPALESGSFENIHLPGENSGLALEAGAVLATEILNNAGTDGVITVKEKSTLAIGGAGLRVANGVSGTMRVEGGEVSVAGDDFYVAGGRSSKGLLEISGGTVAASDLVIASNADTEGTVRISGGVLSVRHIFFTKNNKTSAHGTLELQAGTLSAASFDAGVAPANAVFSWAGGSLALGASNLDLANTGTGHFAVGGAGAVGKFVVADGAAITYTQGKGASLTFDLASDKDFDTFILGQGASCEVNLSGTLKINLLKEYKPFSGRSFDVMTATRIATDQLTIDGAASFTYEVVSVGGLDVLRLKASGR